MSSSSMWDRYCRHFLSVPSVGFSIDISRVRFADNFLAKYRPMLDAAIAGVAELERGAIANRDENRMVGHYWLRAPERAPNAEISREITTALVDVQAFAAAVHAGKVGGRGGRFSHVLLVGIGGSALGPQFVADALAGTDDPLEVLFLDNTDPDGIDRVLARLHDVLDRTLVVVVSKSGSTPETRNGMIEVQAAFRRVNLPFPPQAVAITQEGSRLDQTATSEGWLKRFPMWDWVGGRTSVMSTVGLVPAALQGIDIAQLLAGAAAMDTATREPDPTRNPAALLAMAWHHCTEGRGAKDMVILPYKDRLLLLSRYLQQLIMESLGKQLDRNGLRVEQGIAVYGNKGSTDQHAYVQQLRDGVPNFFATFLQVLKDRDTAGIEVDPGIESGDYLTGFLYGTRAALYDNQRDSITLTIDAVTPHRIGGLIALFERAVSLYAEMVNINAYHQPGVEAGKKAAAKVLELQRAVCAELARQRTPRTAAELAAALNRIDDTEDVFHILHHLSANPSRNVSATGALPQDMRFSLR